MTDPRSDPDWLAGRAHTIPGWMDLPNAAAFTSSASSLCASTGRPLKAAGPSSSSQVGPVRSWGSWGEKMVRMVVVKVEGARVQNRGVGGQST